ncbi:uncharacterized protein LOC143283014 [Babylonia areolata]|uniref:uncharacterized protein LOC143283014 n=1 Tax=Babylonia areolata TaxID=304850 RepID=UPI003FD4B8B8
MPCIAAGDLAHTHVLDSMEELSRQLKLLEEGPLFVISSVTYDNYLAKLQQSHRRKRRKKKKNTDGGGGCAQMAFEFKRIRTTSVGDDVPPPSTDDSDPKDSGQEHGQGKQLLPPRPADRGAQRGEIDVVVLHERRGMMLIEVKSTGYPDPTWSPTEEERQSAIARSLKRAVEQLESARDVLHYIMPDLTLTPVTLVVALPFLTRQQVEQAMAGHSLDPCLRFLCKEDLVTSEDPPASQASPPPPSSSSSSAAAADSGRCCAQQVPALLAWWRRNVGLGSADGMALDTMRTIVGRICGLMSVVSVWTNSKPRVEVRTLAQAIGEAGRRVSDIVLLPRQADLLAQQSLHRVWLTGPMGSGKTLMLQLKGRQWLREGNRVVVINARTIARGRPNGHVLEEGIRQGGEGYPGAGAVDRYDVALDDYSTDDLDRKLAERGSKENLCFVMDEVLSDMSAIPKHLALHYPASPIWCVASYFTPVPSTFQVYQLGAVLRNPPSVQLMLKELDLNPRHKEVYTTRSAARGLPCDGPPIIFIEHAKHDTGVRHLDCLQCAHELADIFETKLGLQLRPPTTSELSDPGSDTVTHQETSRPKSNKPCETIEAAALSFRDILILLNLPLSTFKYATGYHWDPVMPAVLQYMSYMGKSRFFSGLRQRGVPLKVVVDNTIKEVAFPPEDEVIICDIMGAHSLERKVVVFVRGGGPLTEAEVSEQLSRYQTVQAASTDHKPETSKPDSTAGIRSHEQDLGPGQEDETLSKELVIFASMMYEIRDYIYPQLPTFVSPAPEQAKTIIHALLGNIIVTGTQTFVEGKDERQREEDPEVSQTLPTELRLGSEIRGDPSLLRKVSQTVLEESSGGNQMDSSRSVVEANSVFLVPGMLGDAAKKEGEIKRVQRAMEEQSEDDKDWELFAASRCLSQYISILP